LPLAAAEGALWDIGPHALSVLLAVLGQPQTVTASRPAPDVTRLQMSHAGGAVSDVSVSLHAGPDTEGQCYSFRAGDHAAGLEVVPGPRDAAFHCAIDRLVGAMRTGRPDDCDVRFGLRVLRVLAAAEASLVRGETTAVGA